MLFHCLETTARFEPMPPSSWVPERSFINLDPLFPNQSDQSMLDELSVAWLPIVELKNFICCISNGLKRVSKWPIAHQKTKLPLNVFFQFRPKFEINHFCPILLFILKSFIATDSKVKVSFPSYFWVRWYQTIFVFQAIMKKAGIKPRTSQTQYNSANHLTTNTTRFS